MTANSMTAIVVRLALAAIGVAAIAVWHLAAGMEPDRSLPAVVASFGLLLLVVLVIDMATEVTLGSAAHRKPLAIGLFFGLSSGLIGGIPYALGFEGGAVERYVRVIVFASAVGLALHLLVVAALNRRHRLAASMRDNFVVLALLSVLIAGLTTIISGNVHAVGELVNTLPGSPFGWIGSGTCDHIAASENGCKLTLENMTEAQIAFPLLVLGALELLYFRLRVRLKPMTLMASVVGLVLVAFFCAAAVAALAGYLPETVKRGPDFFGNPMAFGLFNLAWVALFLGVLWLLAWTQKQGAAQALAAAFEDRAALAAMLKERLGRNLDRYSRSADLGRAAADLVQAAEDEAWLERLIVMARHARPRNPDLARIADAMGLGIALPDAEDVRQVARELGLDTSQPTGAQFQAILREGGYPNPDDWRSRIAEQEPRICRIEAPEGSPWGTGFLVGPDLVLTAFHVADRIQKEIDAGRCGPGDVVCRFDYRQLPSRKEVFRGVVFHLREWKLIDSSSFSKKDLDPSLGDPGPDELDYALLQLAEPAGLMPVGEKGEAKAGEAARGWITLGNPPDEPKPYDLLFVLQHPRGSPLKYDIGTVLRLNANQTRFHHNANTERGSSGSPCMDLRDFTLLGLHHAGGPGTPRLSEDPGKKYNIAIPVYRILALVRKHLRDSEVVETLEGSDEVDKGDG